MKNKLNSISSNDGRFHDGDPTTGKLGTIVTASWLNDVQDRLQDTFDELNNLLGLASLTPIPAKKNQLAEAITALLDKKVSLGSNETITGEKTFTRKLFALGGLRLSSSQGNANNGHYAEWFADANTVWMTFKGHTYRWHTDGRVSVDNKKFYSELHKPCFADLLDIPTTLSGYGISNFKVETFNGDINTLRTDGHFCISSAANSRNLPVQASGNLQVIAGGVGNERYCHQIFRRHYSREIYGRHQVNGSNDNWSAWSRLDGVDWNDVRNRPTQGAASTSQRGDVLLTNDTGVDSENLALSAKGAKKLSQGIAQNHQRVTELGNKKLDKTVISDAVNSDSRTNVASSKAVKTANDNANGRVSKSGDTMTGVLEINTSASFIRGKKDGRDNWFVGKGSSNSDEITLHSNAYNYGIKLQSDRVQLGKQPYVGDKPVHHSGLNFITTECSEYGGIRIERNSRNDIMAFESTGNRFSLHRRHKATGQKYFDILTPERSGTLMLLEDITSNLATNGWCKLPNGLILQWGVTTIGVDVKITVSFPISFPTSVFNISLSQGAVSGKTHNVGGKTGRAGEISIGDINQSNFKLANDNESSKVYWFALGK